MGRGFLLTRNITLALVFLAPLTRAQQTGQRPDSAPIFRVTVVERTVKAVNYQYRSGPTQIDFRGTVLLPKAKGDAIVESRQGRTDIEAKFEGLSAPQRYSNKYLTYVLWAITPEGRPHNIGELVANSGDKASVHVTTDLQALALIVTAEPYSAVRQPSDVVVLENEIRPDTLGTIMPVEAKYELLPRGEYTWHVPSNLDTARALAPKVSMHEYEAITELYQAQNAVGIARQASAEQFAPDTLARAQQLLSDAQLLHDRKADFRQVVQLARESAQTAEDARMIAQKRGQEEQQRIALVEQSKMRAELSSALQAKQQALADEQQARAQADAARAQAQVALAAKNQAESDAATARERAAEAQQADLQASSAKAAQDQQKLDVAQQRELRMRLLEQLSGSLPTLDTGRGLVATIPDDGFSGSAMRSPASSQVARIAAILSRYPVLRVSVEGYSDDGTKETLSRDRADSVREALIGNGVAAGAVSAAGLGDSRPVGSNATPQGRKANSRVEIVIAGESIGHIPLWERPAVLTSRSGSGR
jgi:outer membrane protein OmpA-like peptidoglycan-associated protein